MSTPMKNELGHRYGDFVVAEYTDVREPSNGCVKWLCECVQCGRKMLRNGNNLRFGRSRWCPYCGNKRR